jgi:hypothetical protein
MPSYIQEVKRYVRKAATRPSFIHHQWFVVYHLDIVEEIAIELCEDYPEARKEMVLLMVWLHDYGKILDHTDKEGEYARTQTEGRKLLEQLSVPQNVANDAMKGIDMMNNKIIFDLHVAPIEVQIVSSADGASHLAGPFMYLWWYENPDRPFEELMNNNRKKAVKDWERKIVLPEVKETFKLRYELLLEQQGELPNKFFIKS